MSNTADKYTDAGTLDSELDDTGLTFHVSYELISTTGEVITVKDATVFVPTDYTNWAPNTHYTYIFKITKNSNGTTDSTDTPNPEDPEVPTEIGLYPIIFDNCTVEEWQTVESEYVISEGTSLADHDVQLSTYSVNNGTATNITVTVTDNDKFNGHSIDYTKVTVTGPDATVSAWYDNATHNISVPATATAGVYTVTYTCTLPTGIQYNNHPLTWTEKFVVNHAYKVKTNLTEVGTHSLADTKLVISTNMDNAGWENATDVTGLSIEYPVNTVDNKVKVQLKNGRACVVVDKGATPGKYRLIYTVKVEGIDVKVAHYDFDVKDYQFALNYANVYNQVGGTTITPTAPAGAVFEYELTDPSGNTTSFTGGIAIPNDSEEGTWTVTGTMHGTTATASKVQYNATFTVLNQYAVTLAYNNASATALNTAEGASNSNDYGTNYIVIASTKNGNADYTDDVTAANMLAKYAVSGLVRDTDYKIELVAESAGTPAYVKLKVNKNLICMVCDNLAGTDNLSSLIYQNRIVKSCKISILSGFFCSLSIKYRARGNTAHKNSLKIV